MRIVIHVKQFSFQIVERHQHNYYKTEGNKKCLNRASGKIWTELFFGPFLRLDAAFFLFLSCECETTTSTLDFNCCWKYRVYDPPLLSCACDFWVVLCTISCLTFPLVYTVCNYEIYLSSFCHWPCRMRSWHFWSLALILAAWRIHKRYRNFNVYTFAI